MWQIFMIRTVVSAVSDAVKKNSKQSAVRPTDKKKVVSSQSAEVI